MKTLRTTLPLAMALAGCVAGIDGPSNPTDPVTNPTVPNPNNDPPPVIETPPTAATWKAGSLTPVFQWTPRGEQPKFAEGGEVLDDTDFISNANNFTTAAQKMNEVGQFLAQEAGLSVPVQFMNIEDQQRGQQIPFRAKPNDLKLFKQGNIRRAFAALGGDEMLVGNEVAMVDLNNNNLVQRIKVCLRPARVAVAADLVFVACQYSNYIMVIDPVDGKVLNGPDGKPIKIASQYYNDDIIVAPAVAGIQDNDNFRLITANDWRHSIIEQPIKIVRDARTNDAVSVSADPAQAHELTGVGTNPFRLTLGQDQKSVFVMNGRGGELASVQLNTVGQAPTVKKRVALGAVTFEAVQINDVLIIGSSAVDRGYPDVQGNAEDVTAGPVEVQGLDGNNHVAHPGASFDNSKAYNFEDVRNGMFTVNANNLGNPVFFTDDNSPEVNYTAQQKIMNGAMPQGIVANAAGTKIWAAMGGSDLIQEFSVRGGNFRLADVANREFVTEKRPWAIQVDEAANELMVVNWGSESMEIFDLTSRQRKARIDLGYAGVGASAYPATNIERGEYLFYNAGWSNNGRKSCQTCHAHALLVDGLPFANGATAPTMPHEVRPNFNQSNTDSFFWNGSFKNGSYASLAADAQSRSNCELILFGEVEGIDSNPATRIGDPANRVTNNQDAQCRPDFTQGLSVLPDNFAQAAVVIANQKIVRDNLVKAYTQQVFGQQFTFKQVAAFTDFYSESAMRLPANPLSQLNAAGALDSTTTAQIAKGKTLFTSAGCNSCHTETGKGGFTDNKNHGKGVKWRQQFDATYFRDPRLLAVLPGGIPQAFRDAITQDVPDKEINIHLNPLDFFEPFCFDLDNCLVFEDPLTVRGTPAEDDRLLAINLVNLANVDRQFVPGNVIGQPAVNTPSLRGVWWLNNFLRHGLARSFREAILAPGHPALQPGEKGWAIDASGNIDVHGLTSTMTKEDIDALQQYVMSIE